MKKLYNKNPKLFKLVYLFSGTIGMFYAFYFSNKHCCIDTFLEGLNSFRLYFCLVWSFICVYSIFISIKKQLVKK